MGKVGRWGLAHEWGSDSSPSSRPLSAPRVSRLLTDARAVLGGRRIREMLAALGKLMPLLRAMGGGGRGRRRMGQGVGGGSTAS